MGAPTPQPTTVAAAPAHGSSFRASSPSGGRGHGGGSSYGDSAGVGGLGLAGSGGGGGGYGAMAPVLRAAPSIASDDRAVLTVTTTTTATTVAVPTPMVVLEAPPVEQQQVLPAGLLTAASVGDADRRSNYLEFLSRHGSEAETLGLDMTRRIAFRVVDAQGRPVDDAAVTVAGAGVQFTGHTHADGSWDFYPGLLGVQAAGTLATHVQVESVGMDTTVHLPSNGDAQGPVVLRLPAAVAPPPPALDLGFVIDVTGSMGDELRYVNREIANIVNRVEQGAPGTHVRVGSTFYRDRVDELVVQQIPFSTNVPAFAQVMQGVWAGGGGDYPEDMNAGLDAAMHGMQWSEGPAVRVMVLIADAPPHLYADEQYTYRHAMLDAAQRGIRIVPVAASGADRTVEFLFRAMGAATNTPYVYLTDDSGVGGTHMEADTDRVAVERFNDLLVRLILSDLHGQGMHEPGPMHEES